jgi:hypothetical protein
VSLNGGANWQRFKNGLPTAPVHDLVIHPREHDLVIATHGRGIYVMDVAPLAGLTPKLLEEPALLFDAKPSVIFRYHGSHGLSDGKTFAAPNPPYGAPIYYYLRERPNVTARLTVVDALGNTVATLDMNQDPGLHRVVWNLKSNAASDSGRATSPMPPGDYGVRLELGEKVVVKKLHLETEE